ncbi:type II secretion system protein N [Robbsia sp. KACC 23696]|uniref:type II secretion system protein N n=1 Tax=Robbsia sp. KACC 23696 TaxID=3149231 RepID=UPI00325BBF2D
MALVAVLAVLLTIGILLPAAWVAPLATRYTQGRLELVDVTGSLWQGSAFLVLAPGGQPDPSLPSTDGRSGAPMLMAARLPYRILWQAAFWPLFTGEVRLDVREDRPLSEKVRVVAGLNGATVSAGGIAVPASLLSGLGAPFNTLDLQGDTRLEWTEWHLLRSGAYGQLTVMLADMSSSVSRVRPLGSYRAIIRANGAGIALQLSTEKGPLFLSGSGDGNAAGFQFSGQARSGDEAKANLSGLLSLLGPRVDANTVALRFP